MARTNAPRTRVRKRVDLCIEGIKQFKTDREIKREVAESEGLSWKSISKYLTLARKQLAEIDQRPLEEKRAQVISMIVRAGNDVEATPSDRINAAMSLAKIWRLIEYQVDIQARVQVEIRQGEDAVEYLRTERRVVRELLQHAKGPTS